MTAGRKLISVVTPCYNEEGTIEECCRVVAGLFGQELADYDFEHILCDNASTDATPRILRDLAARDRRCKVIFNARNFGPFRSLFNGILASSGDATVLFLPADLQDPPGLIVEFVRTWEKGWDIVAGVRQEREEGLLLRTVRGSYYRLVKQLSHIELHNDVGEFQLVDRRVVKALRQFDDYYPYVRGMVAECGFRTTHIPYRWASRKAGVTKNNWLSLFDQGLNGLISTSRLPMRLALFAGLLVALVSLTYSVASFVAVLVARYGYGVPVAGAGVPTLIVALFFFGGTQLFFLGLLGEYVSAIHSQVRRRPLVVERERLNFEEPA